MRILLVEDEPSISLPLIKALQRAKYAVDMANDGVQGWKLANTNEYDCILLDLNLPGKDGIQIAADLRKNNNHTPIIMLTARTQLSQKLAGFAVGADDYVPKPFALSELLARIEAVIRRKSLNGALTYKVGELELLLEINQVNLAEGKKVTLSNKEAALLAYLIRNQGRFVSAEEILEHVWDSEVNIFSDTVRTHIKTLRQKLGKKRNYIKTFRGKGYTIQPA